MQIGALGLVIVQYLQSLSLYTFFADYSANS
jgi:hypothetical protein